ncbi:sigma-54-dependent Fis family transcriptional regulator [Spirochaetia bacterium]|nr:sigma-54-dependent Fis family transcriptional regulator [Spirochaetia bacterium]GHV88844.1 sigma-54-dependent Fis family transcriptional regulator [Spirochaetia bacterium]
MTKILIIDDESGIRRTLASVLEDEQYTVFTAEDALVGIEILEREAVNLIFLDVLLPNLGGLEALEQIRRDWPGVEVVMISGHANVDMAVRAVKLGAFDFLEKPLSLDKTLTTCRNALLVQTLRAENRDLKKKTRLEKDEIIGVSPAIEQIRATIRQAAASDARILITGESGTGKELVARAIHRLSERAAKPFVEVNCAAIPDTLIESELFGHEKGAFTDAVSSRRGRFEVANGGTLFMDEIGDMSLSSQAKVLRVIQEQKMERVGGEKTIETDVRLIAATNKDLEAECGKGLFRQDLFFRLNVIPISLPSLRERREDIPLLLLHFLKELDAGEVELEDDAVSFLCEHDWPGNVRELKNLAERIVVMHSGDRVAADALHNLLQRNPAFSKKSADLASVGDGQNREMQDILIMNYNDARDVFEKQYLEVQLARNGGVISRTAEAIGLYPSNLHAKLRKYGIRTER